MKKIVVIGGGFAGSTISRRLENRFDIILIDSKDYFEFTPGILRTVVDPTHMNKVQILHSDYLKKGKIIIGHVTDVKKDFVIVNKKKITFDYLVICSGSSYTSPIKGQDIVFASRASQLNKYHSRLKLSDNVLLIGGGLTGVELAAEIITKYPKKKVTLVHSNKRLADRINPKVIPYLEEFLNHRGVTLLMENKVVSRKNKYYFTDKGNKIKADIVFWCTGIKPNYDFMTKNFKDSINDKGPLKVNSFLQLNGYSNIFAAGDITDIDQEKTAQNAERHASIVVNNIINLEKSISLTEYVPKNTPQVISLGKYDGAFSSEYFHFTGILPGIMKNFIETKEMLKLRF